MPVDRSFQPTPGGPPEGTPERPRFASVVLTQSALAHLHTAFTYRVPDGMPVEIGSRVRVPFRRRNREGVVVALLDEPDIERPLPIGALLGPGLDADLVDLCRWVADQYLATFGESLAAALPDRVVEEEKDPRDTRAPIATRSLTWLRGYNNGVAIERALAAGKHAGFSWHPGESRAAEIAALVSATAASGRGVIVLVPEVRFVGEVAAALAPLGDAVAWLGSDRSTRERYRAWLALREGRSLIAVGGRAAVYAPVRNLGLVIVDDEAHVSYKERRAPRINARAVASERARRAQGVLIAAGTPPSVEASAAVERGSLTAVVPQASARGRPPVTVVDLSHDGSRLVPHADTLRIASSELAKGRRVVLLIHRAGDEARRASARAGRILKPKRPARLDARTKAEDLTDAIANADLIVATPVIAKDLTIEDVGVVAILEADAALAVPEFRGAEEAFATWWHVARWARKGRMVVETAEPHHPAVRALVRWDPDGLYRWDASRRKETGYPPFAGLARIDVPPDRGQEVAAQVASLPGVTVLGPLERNRRAVVVARARTRNTLVTALRPLADRWRAEEAPIRVDVDPREVLP